MDALTKVPLWTPSDPRLSHESVLPELASLKDEELLPLNVDPVGVVELVFGVWPRLLALRPELAALPGFDLAAFDRLPHYAGALLVAHGRWKGAKVPKSTIGAMAKELMAIRQRLYVNVDALALAGIIEGDRLRNVKKERGHRPLAADVVTLVLLFQEHWDVIAGRTTIVVAELQDAYRRAVELLMAVGVREAEPVRLSEAARERRCVYTLLLRAYEDVRRAVHYLRPKPGVAEKIAPSIYAKRKARRGEAEVLEDRDVVKPPVSEAEQTRRV